MTEVGGQPSLQKAGRPESDLSGPCAVNLTQSVPGAPTALTCSAWRT